MGGKVLILGAAGRLGRAAAEAFHEGGWTVASLVRPGAGNRAFPGTVVVEDDGLHEDAVIEAAAGADVVLHALNTPYSQWAKSALPMAEVAIAAAKSAGATLMFPGNVYGYGKSMPTDLDEDTPMHPSGRKGALRVAVEKRLRAAADEGVRTVILRAGDFYGGGGRGSWFDLVIARDVPLNIVRYPGTLNAVHSWAYLPDLAEAFVRLAEKRAELPPFATYGFPGHSVTGEEMIGAIEQAVGRRLKRKPFPWWALYMMAPVVAHWREMIEVSYLWRTPHRISGEALRAAVGEMPRTPFSQAIRAALDPLSR